MKKQMVQNYDSKEKTFPGNGVFRGFFYVRKIAELSKAGKTVMLACGGGTVQKSGGKFDTDFTKGFFFILHGTGIIRYAG